MLRLALAVIKLSAIAVFVGSLSITTGIPVDNPWFDIAIFLWVFSAVVGGMPEPEEDSNFWYIWAYRTLHLLSATGTAYFIHRKRWKDISGDELDCFPEEKEKVKFK